MKGAIKLNIDNEEYYVINDYKDIDMYRHSLNHLTRQTYGFDFEQWYQQGYWGDKYRPYSILHNDEIVANISANPIDFLIDGKIHHTLQIGTVMTAKNYRHKGLSRELIQAVLSEYEGTCEMIYLYANDNVLGFYPRFGFVEAEEFAYDKTFFEQENKLTVRKINMLEEGDKALITRLVTGTLPVAKYSMVGNPGLVMFYLISFMAEDIYYIEELDLAAVATYQGDELLLIDLFCRSEFNLEQVIHTLINRPKMKVKLGFIPLDTSGFTAKHLKEEGSTFFIKGENLFDKGRLPVLSHA